MISSLHRKVIFAFLLVTITGNFVFAGNSEKDRNDALNKLELFLSQIPNDFHQLRIGLDPTKVSTLGLQNDDFMDYVYLLDTALVYSTQNQPERYTYSYDEELNMTIILQKRMVNQEWVNNAFESIDYNDVNQAVLSTSKFWNGSTYENGGRTAFTYDESNLLAEEVEQVWDGDWENESRITYSRYPNGMEAARLVETWDGTDWENQSNQIIIRNDQGTIEEITFQVWQVDGWENTFKIQNVLLSETLIDSSYTKTFEEGSWVNLYVEAYEFNAQNWLDNVTGSFWVEGSWVNDIFAEYTYNNNGQVDVGIIKSWENDQWLNDARSTYYYNNWNRYQSIIEEEWDGSQWVNASYDNYSFDANGNALEGEIYQWVDGGWLSVQDEPIALTYNYGFEEQVFNGFLVEAAYRSVLVGEAELPAVAQDDLLKLWPNPVSDVIHLHIDNLGEAASVAIYDLAGKMVLEIKQAYKAGNEININVADLEPGLYLLYVQTRGQQLKNKFIKTL
ncbi:MAG: T9SS type A sorting domain-containing protein [Bacteroidetes bacterium]|nr:T9SS type A sorting domain-containing protein [Bacteroidota bacterium]